MRYPIIYAIILLFLFSCGQGSKQVDTQVQREVAPEEDVVKEQLDQRFSRDFLHGTWLNMDNTDIEFMLHLNIVDNLVLGEYCSKAKEYFLEDCSLEDEGSYCSIRGPLNQYNVEIEMESCLNAKIGVAFLRREGDNISLILDKGAGEYGKDHLVPEKMNLKKISNKPY